MIRKQISPTLVDSRFFDSLTAARLPHEPSLHLRVKTERLGALHRREDAAPAPRRAALAVEAQPVLGTSSGRTQTAELMALTVPLRQP